MKAKSKMSLSLIADKKSRRASFKKRKRGIKKKLNELVTLCDVKACAVINSPDDSNLEAWPSREGVQEVFSRFMDVPMLQRTKKMVDQKAYIWERIIKEQEQVKNLRDENREFEFREFMSECLKGKMMDYHFSDARDIRDLRVFIDHYVNELTRRIEVLSQNGESTFFSPPLPLADVADAAPLVVAGVAPGVVADAAAVTVPIGFYHIHQYHIINMQNQNQQEQVQYQAPEIFYNDIQNQNINQQESFQYQTPPNFHDQNQHRFYDMNSNQIMSVDLNHNLSRNSNQYPNQQQSFMDQLMAHPQQMGYVEEQASIPSMDGHHNRYQQLPTTGHMPSITTTSADDFFAPNINNWF